MTRKRTLAQEQELAPQEPAATREPGEDVSEHIVEPNPRSWAGNNAAGVEFLTRKEPYEALIRFKEKPSQEVIDTMKDAGFRWNRWYSRTPMMAFVSGLIVRGFGSASP